MRTTILHTVIPLLMFVGPAGFTACGAARVDPHSASLEEHESVAAKEERAAAEHMAKYDGGPPLDCDATLGSCWSSNPTEKELRAAQEHRKAAAEHRKASAALRDAEAKACAGVSPDDRDISPFHHATDIALVEVIGTPGKETGAQVLFRDVPGVTLEGLRRQLNCHIARNAALGHVVPEMPYCPLVPRDVEVTVTKGPEARGFVVRIESENPSSASEVVKRARMLKSPP